MQRARRIRTGQVKPWDSLPRIDWSHPLAQKLSFYAPFGVAGSRTVELVRGQLSHTPALTGGWLAATTAVGMGLRQGWPVAVPGGPGFKAAVQWPYAMTKSSDGAGGGDYTIALGVVLNALGVASASPDYIAQYDPAGSIGCGIDSVNDGSGNSKPDFWTQTHSVTSNTLLTLKKFASLVASRAAGVLTGYQDGVSKGTVATTESVWNSSAYTNIGVPTGGIDDTTTGGIARSTLDFTGMYVAAWDRSLSQAEIVQLHQDPYCFLIFPEDDTQVIRVSVAAGGSVGTATGTGTASGVGISTATTVGTSSGLGTATAVGASAATTVGSASGTGIATAIGAALFQGIGTTSGIGTATGVGASAATSVGTISGVGTATGIGISTATAVASSSGVGVATGVGSSTGGGSTATSVGVATVTGVGSSLATAVGTVSGTSTVSGVGASSTLSVGTSSGLGSASGVGSSLAEAIANAIGIGTATAVGSSSTASNVGTASGISIVLGVGASFVEAVGSSSGFGTATGISDSIVGGGKAWRWKEGLQKHHTSKTANSSELDGIRKAAAVLSRLGGHARAESLTAKQRTNIASKAANVRWSKR